MQTRTFSAFRANAVRQATVEVRVGSKTGPPATDLVDGNGAPLDNPFPLPSNGRVDIGAPDGTYWINIAGPGFSVWEQAQFLDAQTVIDWQDNLNAAEEAAGLSVESAESAALDANRAEVAAAAVADIDELTINSGKAYPLRPVERNGVTSVPNAAMDNAIVGVIIHGARPGKYYKIGAYANGSSFFGVGTEEGWAITEHTSSTYATLSDSTQVQNIADSAPAIPASGLVERISMVSTRIPGIVVEIWVNTGKLPDRGTYIRASSSSDDGYSWIIDPDRYDFGVNSLTLNNRQNYPLKPKNRGGTTSAASRIFNEALRDIKLIGPASQLAGKYFRLSYLQNNAVLSGVAANGIRVEEYDASTYESAGTGVSIHTPTDAPASYDRDAGGIQTFSLEMKERPELTLLVTLDVDRLPAKGTAVNASSSSANAAWSWIIDQDCLVPVSIRKAVVPELRPLYVEYSASTKALLVASKASNGGWVRMRFAPVGYNSLPNPTSVSFTTAENPAGASWTQVYSMTSEHFGVLHVEAVNDGDSGPRIATGGNHGSNGSAGGDQTAANVVFDVFVDEKRLTADFAGYADSASALVVNDVMGWNTISFPRYVIRQSFQCLWSVRSLSITGTYTALEEIKVRRDRSIQGASSWASTVMFAGGGGHERETVANDIDSGSRSDFPNVWAVSLKGASFDMVGWVDRSFGIADGQYVDAAEELALLASNKFYSSVIYGAAATYPMSDGAEYQWRGGYYFDRMQSASPPIDSRFAAVAGGERNETVVFDDGNTSN